MTLSRTVAMAARALPFALGAYAVFLNASLGRPIWIDEFSHFAFAAEPSTRDAWDRFLVAAVGNQHGQTGIYILLNYWTLTTLGLDPTLLRLPSILSGLLLFGSAIMLFRVLGLSVLWQIVLVGALSGQHMLMHYVGEARAYAPIPAAATGLLLYYVAQPLHPGSRGLLCFGIAVAVFGAIIHPYFALYWPAVCLVAYIHRLGQSAEPFSLASLIRFANPGLVALGAGLYLLLAALTWLRGTPHFAFDPFEWLNRQHGPLAYFTDYSHTQFLHGRYWAAALLTIVTVLGAMALPATLGGSRRALWPPALLMLLAVLISLLLGWISYLSDYWILARQWIGSVALLAIGLVWFWAEAARIWARVAPPLGLAVCIAAGLLVSDQALRRHREKLSEVRAHFAQAHTVPRPDDCTPPTGFGPADASLDTWNDRLVALANRNISCGGPVWPVFRAY
jgi:hypothetical protein